MSKTGPTYYTADQVRQARENVARYDWAKQKVEDARKAVQWVLDMPDEELWQFIPSADTPRALNVHFSSDCPIHGKEVYKAGNNYPWIISRDQPFKVKCPVGGEIYPSNDYGAWIKDGKKERLDTHQKYVDDGFGYVDDQGNHYWFVAYYIFWQRWRTDILPVIPQLAFVYQMTGDARYAHKAAVMLSRVAQEYPQMDYQKQAYHNGYWPARCTGKILDLDWEGAGTIIPLSIAYDQVYDALDKDADLTRFLAGKGISNAKDFFEANFLQEAAKAIETNVVHGNMNYQAQLANVAQILDNDDPKKGYTTDQMVDWIMNGGGEMNALLYNGVSRDGIGSEESIGYSTIWCAAFLDLADRLKPLGYDLQGNPKLKAMADFYIRSAVLGKFGPKNGDGGTVNGAAGPTWVPYILAKAYQFWHDPLYAKALNTVGWPEPSIYDDPAKYEATKEKAKKLGTDLGLESRNLCGYGLGILESGEGDNKRGLAMFYGCSGAWHGHADRLNLQMWAKGKEVLPEFGYPLHWGQKADYFTRSTPSHYCVEIDENRQAKMSGHLNVFAATPGVQVMDASAEDAYPGVASLYRRTVAMVDVSPEDAYVVDVFRVKGGKQHDYIFHGLPFGEFSTNGLDLGPAQAKGSLAGEDVPVGSDYSGEMGTGGLQYFANPRRATPAGTWSANWLQKDGLGLRMTMLPGSAQEAIVADFEPDPRPDSPSNMEFVIARTKGGDSTYVSVIEPYKDKTFIRDIRSIKADGNTIGVQVRSGDRTDQVLISDFGLRVADLAFTGEFGCVSEDARGMRALTLVNGTELVKGNYAIRRAEAPKPKVLSVDFRGNSITLDRRLPMPDALVGQVIMISNALHSTSYTVTKTSTGNGHTVLRLDCTPVEGICELKSMDEATKTVETDTRLSGYGIKWMGKRFPGYALVNHDFSAAWPITAYDSGKFTVKADGPIAPALQAPKSTDRTFFYIGDINPGDEVTVPVIISVRQADRGVYEVRSTVPFELTVPCSALDDGIVEAMIRDQWKPVSSTHPSGKCTVALDGRTMPGGKAMLRVR